MAEIIASKLDPDRFGVKGFYLFGSTKNATAGPKSDIDILIHFQGSKKQQKDLEHWLEGWSLSLDETNRIRTGYKTDGILDIHFVTDADIANKTSYAMKIGAVTDAARPFPMMSKSKNR
jgi:predicted nucleotidyltransferase